MPGEPPPDDDHARQLAKRPRDFIIALVVFVGMFLLAGVMVLVYMASL